MGSTIPRIAYIAEGKLYLKSPDSDAKLVDSPFVQGMIDRAERDRQRNDWKDSGGGMAWNLSPGRMRTGMMPAANGPLRRVQWVSVTSGPTPDEVIYGISAEHVGGIFLHHMREDHERRLLHRNAFVPADLDRNPIDGTLAMSTRQQDGTACISVMKSDGKGLRDLTEGDSIDQSPAWAQAGELIFQSAGIRRNDAGSMLQIGPYAVVKLNTETGELTTLISEHLFDYLTPRIGGDGSTYYIRRPYESVKAATPLQLMLQVLLFPFGLIWAIISFLNVFSIMFASKPLLTSGGPEREGPDLQRMMLWGRLIDAKKVAKAARTSRNAGLVPSSWELRSRKPGSDSEVSIAKGVAAFDVADSTVVYTDGTTIWLQHPSEAPVEIACGHLVERVLIIR